MTSELETHSTDVDRGALRPGVKNVAYLKDVEVDGGTAAAIFAANGQKLALVPIATRR